MPEVVKEEDLDSGSRGNINSHPPGDSWPFALSVHLSTYAKPELQSFLMPLGAEVERSQAMRRRVRERRGEGVRAIS